MPPFFFTADERTTFARDGFVLKHRVISPVDALALANHYDDLFAGRFPTGIYPDEWHWREGISLPDAVREIVNGWKASPAVARIALAPQLGRAAAELLDWQAGARIAQDDVLWKPAGAGGVGYHTDAAYISEQFLPREDNSVTIWIALDAADDETGTVEYAVGSHRWPRASATAAADNATSSDFHGSTGDVASSAYAAAARAGLAHDAVQLRSVAVPRGSAVFHHQDVYHGSRPNTHASRPRRALAVHLLRRDVVMRTRPPPDYIYGRYALGRGRTNVSEAFFPVTWAPLLSGSKAAAASSGGEAGGGGAEREAAGAMDQHRSEAVRALERSGLVDPAVAERGPTLIGAWGGGDVSPGAEAEGARAVSSSSETVEGMLAAWRARRAHEDREGASCDAPEK